MTTTIIRNPPTPNRSSDETFLTTTELASRWRCAPKTLRNRISDRRPMPAITRLPGGPRFALSDVLQFELGHKEP